MRCCPSWELFAKNDSERDDCLDPSRKSTQNTAGNKKTKKRLHHNLPIVAVPSKSDQGDYSNVHAILKYCRSLQRGGRCHQQKHSFPDSELSDLLIVERDGSIACASRRRTDAQRLFPPSDGENRKELKIVQ